MTRKILAYQTPAQLFRSDSVMQREYADCLHITATTSLRKGIGETIRDNASFLEAPVITFNELFSELAGTSWSSQTAQLKQFLALTSAVRELWETEDSMNKFNLQAVSRNQMALLKTIRTLTELEITVDDYERAAGGRLTDDERILIEIWRRTSGKFSRDYRRMAELFSARPEKNIPDVMRRALFSWGNEMKKGENKNKRIASNLFPDTLERDIPRSIEKKKLVLHGFYFITPIQEKIFRLLEKDFELIFLNLYDDRFPSAFETVSAFLETETNEVIQAVTDYASINPAAARLIESLQGDSDTPYEGEGSIYTDLAHFAEVEEQRLKELNARPETFDYRTEHLITPRAEELKKELTAIGFLPYEYDSLTEHPAGRYLYRLHMLKQENTDAAAGIINTDYEVTPDAVLDCFMSGCVFADGINMKDYVKQLEQIMPFCHGVTTFEEWTDKLSELKEMKQEWEDKAYDINPAHTSDPLHKFHALPMRQLSYFYVKDSDIDAISGGIKALRSIHEKLFGSWERHTSIKSHLDRIKTYALHDAPDYFDEEEKKAVEAILSTISEINDEETEFMLKDLAGGLAFYLNNALKELDQEEQAFSVIHSFLNADGAPFYIYRKFHLAFADEKALPVSQGFDLWPVSRGVHKALSAEFKEMTLFEKRENLSRSITRYLLYSLLHSADEIRFSYTENLPAQTDLKSSLYMKLLGCEFKEAKQRPVRPKDPLDQTKHKGKTPDRSHWTEIMKKEASVCPRRAAFSFELNAHTRFDSDFHHRFLYSKFLTHFNAASPAKMEKDIKTVIDDWFPQWNETKKNIIYSESKRYMKNSYSMDKGQDEVQYSSALSHFSLIPDGKGGIDKKQLTGNNAVSYEANPGQHCMYCPYLMICREGIYQADNED